MNGIGCFLEGLQLIRQPGLRRYVVIPLVINVLVLSAAILYGVNQYEAWMAYVDESLPDFLSFLGGVVTVLGMVIGLAVLLYTFTIVANIIAAPFNNGTRQINRNSVYYISNRNVSQGYDVNQ